MKYVINGNYAGVDLAVGGKTYRGDSEGIFEMSDEHANRLLKTRGWLEIEKPPEKPEEEDPAAALKAAVRGLTADPKEPKSPTPPQADPEAPAAPPEEPEKAPGAASEDTAPPAPEASGEAPEEPSAGSDEVLDDEDEDDDAEEGPDLSKMDKVALMAVAKQYGVTVPKKLKTESDIREHLDKALYGEGS